MAAPSSLPPASPPGPPARAGFQPQPFGRYWLVDRIGTGGMAEVFKARVFAQGGFENLVVIKRILPHLSADEDFVRMFLDEARIMVRLRHPNVVQLLDFEKVGEHFYMAMECVEGVDGLALMRRLTTEAKVLPPAYAAWMAHEVCRGLDHAHRLTGPDGEPLGIVHRDISHANILLSWEGEVKVADFGIAKSDLKLHDTRDGELKGKLEYMSPEQVEGQPLDPRSDIFSVGILLFEWLTGRRLFKSDSVGVVMRRIREGDVPAPRDLNPALSEELEQVVLRALQVRPEDRFQDARAFQAALLATLPEPPDRIGEQFSAFLKAAWAEEIGDRRRRLDEGTRVARAMWEAAQRPAPLAPPARRPFPWIAVVGGLGGLILLALVVERFWAAPQVVVREKVVEVAAPSATRASLDLTLDPPVHGTFSLSGRPVGEGQRLLFDDAEPGPQDLRIQAPGCDVFQERVDLVAGVRIQREIRLRGCVEPSASPTSPATAPSAEKGASPREQVVSAGVMALPQDGEPPPEPSDPVDLPVPLQILSEPTGAQVRLDGVVLGRTPYTWAGTLVGSRHEVELSVEGYTPETFQVEVPSDPGQAVVRRVLEPRSTRPAAVATGSVTIHSSPGWATVWIDGKQLKSRTPVKELSLPVGPHEVRVFSPAYQREFKRVVTVVEGQDIPITFQFD